MREKGQTEVAKTLETPVFSRGIEILTEKSNIFEEGFPDKFYISKEERRTDMWGDIGLAPMKEPPSGVYYARFSKEQFIDLLDKFCGGNGGKWLYDEAKKLILDYVGYSDKMRVRATGTNKKSIFFRIDKMTFLPQELRAKLDNAGHREENASRFSAVHPPGSSHTCHRVR